MNKNIVIYIFEDVYVILKPAMLIKYSTVEPRYRGLFICEFAYSHLKY